MTDVIIDDISFVEVDRILDELSSAETNRKISLSVVNTNSLNIKDQTDNKIIHGRKRYDETSIQMVIS